MDKTFTPGTSRLMDQVRETQRYFHDSYSNEKTYIHWILRYIRCNDRRLMMTWAIRKSSVF